MSDLEFQRELTPDQLREALLRLDTAGMKIQKMQVRDLSTTEEVEPGVDRASTDMATQDQLPAAEVSQQRKNPHLNLVGFCGLGIAAAVALTLLSWSERALTPLPLPGIAHEQLSNEAPAQPVKITAAALVVANPQSDQNSGASEPIPSKPPVAGSSPVGHASRDDDQAATKDAGGSASAIHYAAQTPTVTGVATRQSWWDERESRRPKKASWHPRALRVASAEKRFSRRHWQARTEINSAKCFLFVCVPWQIRHVVYEPPRNVN